jgi:hypothetical protein
MEESHLWTDSRGEILITDTDSIAFLKFQPIPFLPPSRAQDKSIFSPVHLNHAPKSAHGCNCQRLLFEDKVAFFTARGIEVNEELSFDYGNNFWVNRKDEIVHE